MTITPIAFVPAQGYRDSSFAPTDPITETQFRDVMQDIPDQVRDYINNELLAKITSTASGSGGSREIGSETIPTITGNNVYTQLVSLLNYINSISIGAVPDNSITDLKLGIDVKIGSISTLTTLDKTNVVSAINELDTIKLNAEDKAADSNLLDGVDSTGYCRDNPVNTTINTGFASGWSGTITIKKNHNNLVEVNGTILKSTTISSTGENVVTFPIGVRPIVGINNLIPAFNSGGGAVNAVLGISVSTGGIFGLYNPSNLSTAQQAYQFKFMYYSD